MYGPFLGVSEKLFQSLNKHVQGVDVTIDLQANSNVFKLTKPTDDVGGGGVMGEISSTMKVLDLEEQQGKKIYLSLSEYPPQCCRERRPLLIKKSCSLCTKLYKNILNFSLGQ